MSVRYLKFSKELELASAKDDVKRGNVSLSHRRFHRVDVDFALSNNDGKQKLANLQAQQQHAQLIPCYVERFHRL